MNGNIPILHVTLDLRLILFREDLKPYKKINPSFTGYIKSGAIFLTSFVESLPHDKSYFIKI